VTGIDTWRRLGRNPAQWGLDGRLSSGLIVRIDGVGGPWFEWGVRSRRGGWRVRGAGRCKTLRGAKRVAEAALAEADR